LTSTSCARLYGNSPAAGNTQTREELPLIGKMMPARGFFCLKDKVKGMIGKKGKKKRLSSGMSQTKDV